VAILSKVKERSGTARHADNSNGEHQKTPGCVFGVAQNAIHAANTMPNGDGGEAELD
jgi:hypothetical protein